jgi:hypothetical protein
MGGSEIEILLGTDQVTCEPAGSDAEAHTTALRAIESKEIVLPGLVPSVGPFPNAKRRAVNARRHDAEATALAHLYAALLADVSLELIGSRDTLLIDGRFSQAPIFVQALAALRPNTTVVTSHDTLGVARGALRLVQGVATDVPALKRVAPLPVDLSAYRARWREAVGRLA